MTPAWCVFVQQHVGLEYSFTALVRLSETLLLQAYLLHVLPPSVGGGS